MDAINLKDIRRQLSSEVKNLAKSMNLNRLAVEEIKLENTEDEGDRAAISHDRDVLYNLHEGGFARLQSIQNAIKAIDRGEYGQCVRCAEDINEKRLMAIPWATMCIQCQEGTEAVPVSPSMALIGLQVEELEP